MHPILSYVQEARAWAEMLLPVVLAWMHGHARGRLKEKNAQSSGS